MKKILVLSLLSSSLYCMDIKIPPAERQQEKALQILHDAGSNIHDVKVQALLHAFDKMQQQPVIARSPSPEEDPVIDNAGYLRNLWLKYHTSAKTVKHNHLESEKMQAFMLDQQRNAKDLIDKALELFVDQQNREARSQRIQKYVILALGAITTIASAALTSYFGSQC